MQPLTTLYPHKKWAVIHQDFTQQEGLVALAHTNTLLAHSNQFLQPIIHFWTLPHNVILGMMDTKLPDYSAAVNWLDTANYSYTVRNAGGLGVIADQGILNVSLYLPGQADRLTINAAYDLVVTWLQQTFTLTEPLIQHFEISQSYCPGSYDLSLDGKKFAGIAQRRSRNGIAILLYISVAGNQESRGHLMQQFYQFGQAQEQNHWHFPSVVPSSMANLSELLNQSLSIETVQTQLLACLNQRFKLTLTTANQLTQTDGYLTDWAHQKQLLLRYQS